jgi:hypothetical protein
MTCSRNPSKHLKIVTKPKPVGKMFQRDIQFFANLMIFSPNKKVIKYLLFTFVQNFKPKKKKVMTCVFENFQSHCYMLKELHEFYYMMSAITIFEKNSFIFSLIMNW